MAHTGATRATTQEELQIAEAAAAYASSINNIIDESNFLTPGMGDFYVNAIDDTYLKLIAQKMDDNDSDAAKAAFYCEQPLITDYGRHDQYDVSFIRAKVDTNDVIDGDTISVALDNILDADEQTINYLKKGSLSGLRELQEPDKLAGFSVRFLGIDAPEIPKFAYDEIDLSKTETTSASIAEAISKNYLFIKGLGRPEEEYLNFLKIAGAWSEYEVIKTINGKAFVKWVIHDDSQPDNYQQGIDSRRKVQALIQKSGGIVYFLLDHVDVSKSGIYYPRIFGSEPYNSDLENQLKTIADNIFDANTYKNTGYNLYGQDTYRRFLGSVYLKIDGTWINLAKYLITEFDQVEINPSFKDSTFISTTFKKSSAAHRLSTYDYNNIVWADAVWDASNSFDDRRQVQKEIFGRDFDDLKEWTLTIGDTTFFVPPTSIKCLTQTTSERMPVVRAKGSMTKSAHKSERILELNLYFNDDRGINGYKIDAKLPGQNTYYFMNGLRALVAQFKLTPFLPIDNHYVNEVLNIESVALVSLQISTVPGFPKLIQANLVMQEFNYRVYLPEMPVRRDEDEEFRNYFASTINFSTQRYYYQRQIMNGEKLSASGHAYNSTNYIKEALQLGTALYPMKWHNSNISFYIANEDHLKKLLQSKLLEMRRNSLAPELTKEEISLAYELATVYDVIMSELSADDLTLLANKEVNEYLGLNMDEGKPTWSVIKEEGPIYTYSQADCTAKIQAIVNKVEDALAIVNGRVGRQLISSIRMLPISEKVQDSDDSDDKKSFVYKIVIVIDSELKQYQQDALLAKASQAINADTTKFFVGNKIILPLRIDFPKSVTVYDSLAKDYYIDINKKGFYIDAQSPEVQFLAYCQSETFYDEVGVSELKNTVDIDAYNSIVYDLYDVGEISINSLSVTMNNTYAKIGVSALDGDAPQYMGGQDSAINISMTTQSKATAAMLNALPKLSAMFAREYKLVLPCWPLRLESEITLLLGINDTLVESVVVATVENFPGTYEIQMKLVSVDKTLRNREALNRIERANGGHQSAQEAIKTQTKSYFDLNNVLAQAEIYPDLELPTIADLTQNGFNFVRYKMQDSRIYPDPDFYFVYAHLLSSQIYRETILSSVQHDFSLTKWLDGTGASLATKVEQDVGVSVEELNSAAQKQKDLEGYLGKTIMDIGSSGKNPGQIIPQERINEKDASEAKQDSIYGGKKSPEQVTIEKLSKEERAGQFAAVAFQKDATEAWDISKDIKCIFLEKNYKNLLESYNWIAAEVKADRPEAGSSVWIRQATEKARQAAILINKYLESNPINEKYVAVNFGRYGNLTALHNYLNTDKDLKTIFHYLNIDYSNKNFYSIVSTMVYGAACAASGKEAYKGGTFNSWKPDARFLGVKSHGGQDKAGSTVINDNIDDAIENAYIFSPFAIKMYTKDQLEALCEEQMREKSQASSLTGYEKKQVNSELYLLDPYYRYAQVDEIKNYKRKCIENYSFAAIAYFRLALYWLRILIIKNAYPAISTDVLRNAIATELRIQRETSQELGSEVNPLVNHISFFREKAYALDNGKIFAALVLAITEGDQSILNMIETRDYAALNAYIQSCISAPSLNAKDKASLVRKFILSLVGSGVIAKPHLIGTSVVNPATQYTKNLMERIYLKAAEDPQVYVMHSFHDMVVNDGRGRMLRAFPTLYMLFIDEGREYGMYKLHDNFYNTSSIAEIQVVKSRKMAADSATILMSNMYKTFTTEDEDSTSSYSNTFQDVWTSIWNPKEHVEKMDWLLGKNRDISRARLRPGARIHIRMGYGSNASTLPIVFNGCLTEVQANDVVTLVAQGDGVELVKPVLDTELAHEVKYKNELIPSLESLAKSGGSPKEIIDAIFTVKGSYLAEKLKNTDYAHLFERNPYGIYHFGNPDYQAIFKRGEITQNIYEAVSTPSWGGKNSITQLYEEEIAPRLTFPLLGKTVWDIANICRSTSPDFILGVAPFGFRSTLFHGAARYYYAYEYSQLGNTVLEKRKPYQQYHIFTAYSDIVKNNITLSSTDVKTCAVGLYTQAESFGNVSSERVGPLWADISIYPEEQKTVVIDTQLFGKGTPLVGYLSNTPANMLSDIFGSASGIIKSNEKLAWRMTASKLKDTLKDMYQNELILLGNASVKPYDRLFVDDAYENMNGQCLARDVVHNFSVQDGFITSVYPDCIVVVDDPHELAVQSLGNSISSASSFVNSILFTTATKVFGGAPITLDKALNAMKSRTMAALSSQKPTNVLGKYAVGKIANNVKKTGQLFNSFKSKAAEKIGKSALTKMGLAMAPWLGGAAVMATTIIIGRYVTNAIARWAKNLQTVQVFPLKRNGLTMTAGLNGSKGVVYGSPSYKERDFLKSIYSNLTAASDNPAIRFFQEWFFSEEMMALGEKYKADNGLVDEDGLPVEDDLSVEKSFKLIAGMKRELENNYRSVRVTPRAAFDDRNALKKARGVYSLENIEDFEKSPVFSEYVYLSNDRILKPYMQNGFLKCVHDLDGLPNDDEKIQIRTLSVNGKAIKFRAIVGNNPDNSRNYNIPFLHKDAVHVLHELTKRSYNLLHAEKYTDELEKFRRTKGSFLVVKSALRINDKTSFADTGFVFVLEPTGEAVTYFDQALEELQSDIVAQAQENPLLNKEIFKVFNKEGASQITVCTSLPAIDSKELVIHDDEES